MRLCYVAPAASIHTQRWLQAFAGRGHEVHLIAFPAEQADLDGVIVHRLQTGTTHARFARLVVEARRLLGDIQPDIVHGHFITRYGWLAALSLRRPLVITAWGTDAYIDPERSRLVRFVTRWTLRRADLVTVDAQDLCDRVIQLGARPERTRIIQWGVDTKVFRPDVDSSELRERLDLGAGPVILSTRGLKPVYNQDIMVQALPAILRSAPTARLIIKYQLSDPEYAASVRKSVSELSLEHAVRFVTESPYEELPAYYALADVFVSIASSDSTPVSLLEALACGAAPVTSDLPALREWVRDGVNGFCVPARDPSALAAAVTRLLAESDLRRSFVEANLRMVRERADHTRQMDEMERLYLHLANERARRRT
jgi:glycosyltransferase involved in cell wall biosynthesis